MRPRSHSSGVGRQRGNCVEGWIKLHRKICGWEWYTSPNTAFLFIHLLLNANHEDNRWRGIEVKAGEIISGLPSLSKATGLSTQSLRTSLNHLKSTGEVTVKSTNKYSIITIIKWNSYQLANRQPNSQLTGNQQATNNKQEGKELKNEKNNKKEYTSEFLEFWEIYPRHDGSKAEAFRAYEQATKGGADHGIITAGATAFNEVVRREKTEKRFIPHATTWLNQRRWETATDHGSSSLGGSDSCGRPAPFVSRSGSSDNKYERAKRAVQQAAIDGGYAPKG